MLDLILASGNQHKASEFSLLFDKSIILVKAADKKIEVEESGESYTENAFIKAEAYYNEYKLPVISDDSGLTVDALPDELGIFSARFGGPSLTDQDRAKLLLAKLAGRPKSERTAFFTCMICIYLSPEQVYFFEGRLDGYIGTELKGEAGFGYDPVFLPKGRGESVTLAMIPEWKMINSHRALACHGAQKFFRESNCQTV